MSDKDPETECRPAEGHLVPDPFFGLVRVPSALDGHKNVSGSFNCTAQGTAPTEPEPEPGPDPRFKAAVPPPAQTPTI